MGGEQGTHNPPRVQVCQASPGLFDRTLRFACPAEGYLQNYTTLQPGLQYIARAAAGAGALSTGNAVPLGQGGDIALQGRDVLHVL